MDPKLTAVRDELDAARQRCHRLADSLSDDEWSRRPEPERWSVAETVVHLNLTSLAFLPKLSAALSNPAAPQLRPGTTVRRDPVGWLLSKLMEPPVRVRLRTATAYVPVGDHPKPHVLGEFDRLQDELIALIGKASGVDLRKIMIDSPFAERVRYNVYAAWKILAAHQRRHLWVAERARRVAR